jgi:hypothetical protein
VGSVTLTTWHPLSAKVGNDFADKRRSLGRCSLLADSDHGGFFFMFSLCALICMLVMISRYKCSLARYTVVQYKHIWSLNSPVTERTFHTVDWFDYNSNVYALFAFITCYHPSKLTYPTAAV